MNRPTTRREFLRTSTFASAAAVSAPLALAREHPSERRQQRPVFRAGAAEVDISPPRLPVVVSGGFLEGTGGELRDRLCTAASSSTMARTGWRWSWSTT